LHFRLDPFACHQTIHAIVIQRFAVPTAAMRLLSGPGALLLLLLLLLLLRASPLPAAAFC
jgi:hypothetical protein